MDRLEELKNHCIEKDIIVVGNGQSLMDMENGEIIDNFDVVVRINHGYPRDGLYLYTGRKTDIWVCAFNGVHMQPRVYNLFNPKFLLRLNNDTHLHPSLKNKFIIWDLLNWEKVKIDLGTDKLPSTGIVTIFFFLKFLKLNTITITGFDFFEFNNFYEGKKKSNTVAKRWHIPELEKEYVYKFIDEGKIKVL